MNKKYMDIILVLFSFLNLYFCYKEKKIRILWFVIVSMKAVSHVSPRFMTSLAVLTGFTCPIRFLAFETYVIS